MRSLGQFGKDMPLIARKAHPLKAKRPGLDILPALVIQPQIGDRTEGNGVQLGEFRIG